MLKLTLKLATCGWAVILMHGKPSCKTPTTHLVQRFAFLGFFFFFVMLSDKSKTFFLLLHPLFKLCTIMIVLPSGHPHPEHSFWWASGDSSVRGWRPSDLRLLRSNYLRREVAHRHGVPQSPVLRFEVGSASLAYGLNEKTCKQIHQNFSWREGNQDSPLCKALNQTVQWWIWLVMEWI